MIVLFMPVSASRGRASDAYASHVLHMRAIGSYAIQHAMLKCDLHAAAMRRGRGHRMLHAAPRDDAARIIARRSIVYQQ